MNLNLEKFQLLRKISTYEITLQSELAKSFGFSLRKLNYCLKKLMHKRSIKLNNFKENKRKPHYMYLLNPKVMANKIILTFNYMDQKFKEYDQLKMKLII